LACMARNSALVVYLLSRGASAVRFDQRLLWLPASDTNHTSECGDQPAFLPDWRWRALGIRHPVRRCR
jgi:hypothetical protein